MEQNKEPRNKITPLKSIFDKVVKTYNGLKIVYSINGVGNIGQIHAEKRN